MRGRYHRALAQVWILLAGSCTKRERPKGLSHSLALFSSVAWLRIFWTASDKHCKGLVGRGEREGGKGGKGGREGGRAEGREGGREGGRKGGVVPHCVCSSCAGGELLALRCLVSSTSSVKQRVEIM